MTSHSHAATTSRHPQCASAERRRFLPDNRGVSRKTTARLVGWLVNQCVKKINHFRFRSRHFIWNHPKSPGERNTKQTICLKATTYRRWIYVPLFEKNNNKKMGLEKDGNKKRTWMLTALFLFGNLCVCLKKPVSLNKII